MLRRQRGVHGDRPAGVGASRASPTASSCASPRRSRRCGRCRTATTIDLAFIDADKPNYVNYYDELLPRLRRGGLILADNTLWSGRVADPPADDDADNLAAIRQFNDHVAADDRVASYILPVSDGLTVIAKL